MDLDFDACQKSVTVLSNLKFLPSVSGKIHNHPQQPKNT